MTELISGTHPVAFSGQIIPPPKLNIVIYSTQVIPTNPDLDEYGGLELIAGIQAKYFAEQGHDVHLFACKNSYFSKKGEIKIGSENGHLYAVGEKGTNPVQAWKAYWDDPRTKAILKEADIIVNHSWNFYPYAVYNELKNICSVWHGPDPGFLVPPPYPTTNLIAISFSHAQRLMKMAPGTKYRTIQNGLPIYKYTFNSKPIAERERLLWLSRIYEPKGAHRAIDIANSMKMPIDIVGGSFGDVPAYTDKIKKMCEDSQYATFHGEVNFAKKLEFYRNAKCVILPIIESGFETIQAPGWEWHEPFGLITGEAGACLPGNEIIFSNYQPIPIKDIKKGDIVNSSSGNSVVLKTFKRKYNGKLISIKLQGLPKVSVTEEHPILVCEGDKIRKQLVLNNTRKYNKKYRNGKKEEEKIEINKIWKKAKEIKEKDYLLIPRGISSIEKKIINITKYIKINTHNIKYKDYEFNNEIAYIFGWFLAEGYASEHAIQFDLNHKDDAKKLIFLLDKYFGNPKIKEMGAVKRIIIRNAPLGRFLVTEFGKNALEKRIPSWIINTDNSSIKQFLTGYIQGDGCISKHHRAINIQIKTASKNIAFSIIFLLNKLGIQPCIDFIKRETDNFVIEGRKVHQNDAYNIRIFGKELELLIDNYKHNSIDHRHHFITDEWIVVPITKIIEKKVNNYVYNIATTDQTYLMPFTVHNCGTPTIVTPNGGWTETMIHGYNGYFANSNKEFEYYLKQIDNINPADCRTMAERFDYKIMGENYLRIFKEIIETGGW